MLGIIEGSTDKRTRVGVRKAKQMEVVKNAEYVLGWSEKIRGQFKDCVFCGQ